MTEVEHQLQTNGIEVDDDDNSKVRPADIEAVKAAKPNTE